MLIFRNDRAFSVAKEEIVGERLLHKSRLIPHCLTDIFPTGVSVIKFYHGDTASRRPLFVRYLRVTAIGKYHCVISFDTQIAGRNKNRESLALILLHKSRLILHCLTDIFPAGVSVIKFYHGDTAPSIRYLRVTAIGRYHCVISFHEQISCGNRVT